MIYLDHASASSPIPDFVIGAVTRHLKEITGSELRSSSSGNLLDTCRTALSSFLGLNEDHNLIFTKNATEAFNLYFFGFDKKIANIFIDSYSHNAVIRPAHEISLTTETVVHVLSRKDNFIKNIKESLKKSHKTNDCSILCVNAASNVTGEVLTNEDFNVLFHLTREHENLHVFFDFSQFTGNFKLPQIPEDVNYYVAAAASAHKYLLAPESLGFLFFHKNIKIKPLLFGGTGFDSELKEMPNDYPYKLEAGTYPMTSLCGLNASIEKGYSFFNEIYERKLNLGRYFFEEMQELKTFQVYGVKPESNKHSLVFSIAHQSLDSSEIAFILYENYQIITREGFHCSPLTFSELPEIFHNGSLRISLGWNTSQGDIENLLSAMKDLN